LRGDAASALDLVEVNSFTLEQDGGLEHKGLDGVGLILGG
jgi:hypothetical protein